MGVLRYDPCLAIIVVIDAVEALPSHFSPEWRSRGYELALGMMID